MKGDSGSATVLLVVSIGLVAVVATASVALSVLLAARETAMTAADAAALAAAVATYPPAGGSGPHAAANEYATRNGALLVRCGCRVNQTLVARVATVVTRVDVVVPLFGVVGIHGAASAEFDPRAWLGG